MNCEIELRMSALEAKCLWEYMNTHQGDLGDCLISLMRRVEAGLWDALSIDEMGCKNEQ